MSLVRQARQSALKRIRGVISPKRKGLMFINKSLLLIVILSAVVAHAQVAPEQKTLSPGQPVENEIAGGELHLYQVRLTAGQFMRVVAEQKGIGVTLLFASPDGKVVEVNLTAAGGLESFSTEAAASGDHRLTVRAGGSAATAGAYQLRLEVKPAATATDRQRIAAERWMLEASELRRNGGQTAEQSIDKLQQALSVWRELGDKHWAAWCLYGIGLGNYDLSRYELAIEYNEQALAIHREVNSRAGEAQALNNLGLVLQSLGRYEMAVAHYEPALSMYRELKDRNNEGGALNNLGIVYEVTGQPEKAIEYFKDAIALHREVSDRGGEGVMLNNIGISYKNLGRYEEAIGYYEQALAISRETKDRTNQGRALNNLGIAYRDLGFHDQAIASFEQALTIQREVKNRASEARALDNLGISHERLGLYDKAISFSEQALAIRREVKDRPGLAISLNSLARAELSRGNLPAARTYVEESLMISESLRSDLLSPNSRSSFLASVQNSYRLYTELSMLQHRAEPSKGFDARAVEISERQRARSLLDLLAEANADAGPNVDPRLIGRVGTLSKQLNDKVQQLTTASGAEQVAALKQEVSSLENELERAQAAIRKINRNSTASVQPRSLTFKEMQEQLDPDTLLLEYSLGEKISYLWVVSKDSLTSYELPKEELIKKQSRQVYELLTGRSIRNGRGTFAERRSRIADADAKLPAAAAALSHMILGPAAAQLGSKRLVIVSDGALQYIPFAMLPNPAAMDEPLIVAHEVVSLPSASVLAIQRADLGSRQLAPKMLAVIADPVFDRTDIRLKSSPAASANGPTAQPERPANTRGLEHIAEASDGDGRLVIRRLPFTRQEADGLTALTPKNSSWRAINFDASRANVLRGDLAQYRYVHFATHGLLDTERPGLSALVLSTVDASGRAQDGFLRANDIYNMKLPAELVVLSACQTGLGKEVKGEGLIGLTRGFMYAGAKRVVVSLWSVNDKATADLMTRFYKGMLKDNQRPVAALRAAQIEMWKQKKWRSPYYWAAFTMQGEWR